jgi:hypothetical protein
MRADRNTSTARAGAIRITLNAKKPGRVRQRSRLPATRNPLKAKNIGTRKTLTNPI